MTKKILITGGAGYIGSHACLAALDAGYEVAVIDNLCTGVKKAIPQNCKFYEGDIADRDFVSTLLKDFKPTEVMHFAGSVVVPESVSNPAKYYQNNTYASLCLIEESIAHDIEHFVFSSTAAVYGIPQEEIVTEETSTFPINPYGHSKLFTEQILADMAHAHGLKYAALRYFNVAGADLEMRTGQSTANATHLIKVACQASLGQHADMKVFGTDYDTADGTCVRDFIHVSDLVDAHLSVLDHLKQTQKSVTFNCGNGKGYSVKDVLDVVQKISGEKLNIKNVDRRAGDPPTLIANPQAIQQATSWRAKHVDLDIIVKTAYEWERSLRTRI